MKRNNPHIGSTLDDFLREEGIFEEVTNRAAKRLIAIQLEAARKERKLSKHKMAAAMKTSRAALDRLFDPTNTSVTLHSIAKAASVLGKQMRLSFVDA